MEVAYFPLPKPIPLAELPDVPLDSGPFDRNGAVKVGYLQEIDQGYAERIHQAFIDRWPIESPWSSATCVVDFIPLEDNRIENFQASSDRKPYDAERRESTLVAQYGIHLQQLGHIVTRFKVTPHGESAAIYSDLWDHTTCELVEAKGSANRNDLRLAVGQLLDYARFVESQTLAVLVPERPSPDLVSFLLAAHVTAIYPNAASWSRIEP